MKASDCCVNIHRSESHHIQNIWGQDWMDGSFIPEMAKLTGPGSCYSMEIQLDARRTRSLESNILTCLLIVTCSNNVCEHDIVPHEFNWVLLNEWRTCRSIVHNDDSPTVIVLFDTGVHRAKLDRKTAAWLKANQMGGRPWQPEDPTRSRSEVETQRQWKCNCYL
jgi:hypothetical protein